MRPVAWSPRRPMRASESRESGRVTFCRGLGRAAGAHWVAAVGMELMALLPWLREAD